jgi:NAD(P)-dependent dehydrogenase (short-subunit alcohol dehydrogenase family)
MSQKSFVQLAGLSGIGRATALAFAQEEASVVVVGRRESEGAVSVALIEQTGGKGLFVQADVSVEDDVAAMVAKTLESFGKLDFTFNNAGVFLESAPITEVTQDTIDRILAINVRGVALCLLPSRQKNTYSRRELKAIAVVPNPASKLSINTGQSAVRRGLWQLPTIASTQ